jgi:hypothetical protein
VQVVDEVPRIDLMDGDDAQGVVVEVGQPRPMNLSRVIMLPSSLILHECISLPFAHSDLGTRRFPSPG